MKSQYGPADFPDGTHHNWYLFEDKIDLASSGFEVIEVSKVCQENTGMR